MMKQNESGLELDIDPQSGQMLACRVGRREIFRFGPGVELELNGHPLPTRLLDVAAKPGEHITRLEAYCPVAYGAGATLHIRRVLTRGDAGLHAGPRHSVHLRYEIRRVAHTEPRDGLDYIWQPELEAPVRLDTVGVLCAPSVWFGKTTRMRAIAIGGSGPREHVSIEDGPVPEVVRHLQSGFRTTFPGQPSINGALFYNERDERFVWLLARRPATLGRMEFGEHRQLFRFSYFADMGLQQEWTTPAISWLWGEGLSESDRVLAAQFDRYEEPPAWWSNTTWFWLHPNWQRDGSFEAMGRGAEILMDECGVNGFGLFTHDVPWSGNDCDVRSPGPSPTLGGDAALRRAIERIRAKGGHAYTWISRCGHRADATGWKESWAVRGVDGRPVRIYNRPDSGVRIDVLNCADPSFQDYIMEWIEYYVTHIGVTGFFWDSGLQPVPPDFGNKPYLRWPAESTARILEFYEKVYRFGRSLSPDFFMWAEGLSTDVPMNAFAVDSRAHGACSGHALMQRIAHLGGKRLVWRSAWPHDLASGFPFIQPFSDIGWNPGADSYRKVAADPMNRWICGMVKERGTRQAVGLADGVSLLDEFVVACPGITGKVLVPSKACRGRTLEQVITKRLVKGRPVAGGVLFNLPESGAYGMRS